MVDECCSVFLDQVIAVAYKCGFLCNGRWVSVQVCMGPPVPSSGLLGWTGFCPSVCRHSCCVWLYLPLLV